MKLITIIILTFLFISCEKKKSHHENIIGDWILVRDTTQNDSIPPLPPPGSLYVWGQSYSFYKDGIADIRRPKFEISERGKRGERKVKYLGSLTQYKIEGDSLFFLNSRDSVWSYGRRVVKLNADSLILEYTGVELNKFVRSGKKTPEVDEIILSTSGCYGSCPILNIIVKSTGEVVFYGEKYIENSGFYESKIEKDKYGELLKNFYFAEFQKADSVYAAGWTDDEEITITFIKNDTILKSISDYGKTGPSSLVYAYVPLRYLYQSIDLKKLEKEELPVYLSLHYFKFEKNGKTGDLTKAESFALWNYLREGQRVEQDFEASMKLSFARNYIWAPSYEEINDPYNMKEEEQVSRIETDGRLFKFHLADNDSLTIDIGFNFFRNNMDRLHFRDKKEYEE